MTKITFISVLFLSIFLNVNAHSKTYFVDVNFILNNSNLGKNVIINLKDINTKNISEYKNKEEKLKNLENEIAKVKNIISENELKVKIDNLKKEISFYRTYKEKTSKEFNTFREKELQNFFKKITPFIEKFMKKNSIDIVLDKKNIFIADSKYDITESLIKFLNENN